MNVRNLAITAGLIGVLTTTAAYANTMSAQEFVTKASIANKFEIESSQLALDKSENEDVKSFARHMVDDHSATGEKLNEVLEASDSNIQPAANLDRKHQKLLDKLEASSDEAFDRQYIAMQTDAHKTAVNLFSGYAMHGKNRDLRDFARETLPALKGHLKHARQLKAKQ